MVLDFIGSISSSARRELARNLFSGFYDRGISANEALRELQASGLGYKRQDFLNDFRQGESAFDQATKIRFVRGDRFPSESLLEPSYHGVPDKYSLVFKAEGIDKNTGEDREQYFFMHRNTLDTINEMEGEAYDWMADQADSYGFDVDSVSVVEGYINPLWA